MDLRAIIAGFTLASSAFAQSRVCEPLEYYWPHAPHVLYEDAPERSPGLELRVLAESEKIPGVYRTLLERHSSRPSMVISYDPPSQVSYFESIDPDRLTTAGKRVDESAAFVSIELMRGYYNPQRVLQGTASANAILHEYGHLVYRVLALPESPIHGEFREASESFRPWAREHYPQRELSDERYEDVLDDETFAEAFARMYHRPSSRAIFEEDHPELASFMLSLEDYAIDLLDELHAFDYEGRCQTARLINPDAWRPQIILNVPESPR